MLLIAGTVPFKNFPLVQGKVRKEQDQLFIDQQSFSIAQGSGAMIACTMMVAEYLGLDSPTAVVVGDIGDGKGSRQLYSHLIDNMPVLNPKVLTLHYCMPYMLLTKKLCESVDQCSAKPVMIADAGSMYAAKASGMAAYFDVFTPDATEIAFLADPYATHPAYIAQHLFDTDIPDVAKLAEQAYKNNGAARLLVVKGKTDHIIQKEGIIESVDKPNIPAMEAIGGTGDTITGLITGLAYAGMALTKAAVFSVKANRRAGKYAQAKPDTRISQVISQMPQVLKDSAYAQKTLHQ